MRGAMTGLLIYIGAVIITIIVGYIVRNDDMSISRETLKKYRGKR